MVSSHARIQGFLSGGGSRPNSQKTAWTFFFLFLFFSSAYFTVYRGGPMALLLRKLNFQEDPEGVQHFPGGPTFSRGDPNANFYRNPYNLWFSRGVRTPYPPSGSALGSNNMRLYSSKIRIGDAGDRKGNDYMRNFRFWGNYRRLILGKLFQS